MRMAQLYGARSWQSSHLAGRLRSGTAVDRINDRKGFAITTKRNIFLWYVLTIVTLGICGIVWYYKLNKDAKTITGNKAWSPGMSVLAITLGAIIIIPFYVSYWKTWGRVRQATNADGMAAGLQFCLIFIPIVNIAYLGYLQSKLNRVAGSAAPVAAIAPA
jgi:uncharacterized protein DUF4234